MRFDAAGNERPDFPLNRPEWRDARIIVGGRNFGGGSSREAAVYALYDYGIRCVIAPSFGDIFSQNATKNGLLTAVVSEAENGALMTALIARAGIGGHGRSRNRNRSRAANCDASLSIDPARRTRLLNGWDDFDVTNSFREQIRSVQGRRPQGSALGGSLAGAVVADLQNWAWRIGFG